MAGLITAGAALLTMLFLASLVGRMPQATLAAVVIVYSIGLIQPADFRAIVQIRRTEFIWALSALAVERIAEKMRALVQEAKPKVAALDLSGVFDLEYTALKMLIEAEKRQRERGVSMWLVGLNPEVL
jgi:MFS superfamily sulfate permease-like transporter